MSKLSLSLAVLFCFFSNLVASDYQIIKIAPIFNDSASFFGGFKIKVIVKNNTKISMNASIVCMYIGLTKPGVYFKDEPHIIKQYLQLTLGAQEQKELVFNNGFISYHPETLGEIIVSLVGTEIIKSVPLKTSFAPESED